MIKIMPLHIICPEGASVSGDFSAFVGAFAGAFFAFMFGLIAYRITKRWELFATHKNAVVKLERMMTRHLDEMALLEHITNDCLTILREGKVTANRLFPLKIPEGLDMELLSLELVNKLFAHQNSIDRHNLNATHLNAALTRFEDLLIAGQSLHHANIVFATSMLTSFKEDLPRFTERMKDFFVVVRIHLKKMKEGETLLSRTYRKQWDFEISDSEKNAERAELEREIIEVNEQSN